MNHRFHVEGRIVYIAGNNSAAVAVVDDIDWDSIVVVVVVPERHSVAGDDTERPLGHAVDAVRSVVRTVDRAVDAARHVAAAVSDCRCVEDGSQREWVYGGL